MSYKDIPIGKNPPHEVNALIEIPIGGKPIKYELDKKSGRMIVDRFLNSAMNYPGNYGFVPHTLSEDGDPIDILVVSNTPVMSGAIIPAVPVGVILMEDESGKDEKIIAVPAARLGPYFDDIKDYKDLKKVFRDEIEHFFKHYKDTEKGKWTKIHGWGDAAKARTLINEAIDRENQSLKKQSKKSPKPKGP